MDPKKTEKTAQTPNPATSQSATPSKEASLNEVESPLQSEKKKKELREIVDGFRTAIFIGKVLFGPRPGASNFATSDLPIPVTSPYNITTIPEEAKIALFDGFLGLERLWKSMGVDMRIRVPPGVIPANATTTTLASSATAHASQASQEGAGTSVAQQPGLPPGPSRQQQPKTTALHPRFSNPSSASATGVQTSGTPSEAPSAPTLVQRVVRSESGPVGLRNGVSTRPSTQVRESTATPPTGNPMAGGSASLSQANVIQHFVHSSITDKTAALTKTAPIPFATTTNKRKRSEEDVEVAPTTKKAKALGQKSTADETEVQAPETTVEIDEGPMVTFHIFIYKVNEQTIWERPLYPPVVLPRNLPLKKLLRSTKGPRSRGHPQCPYLQGKRV